MPVTPYCPIVAVVIISAPAIVDVDPMFTLPPMPQPPSIVTLPVYVDVLFVFVLIVIGL